MRRHESRLYDGRGADTMEASCGCRVRRRLDGIQAGRRQAAQVGGSRHARIES
jgi:hypothetical protein